MKQSTVVNTIVGFLALVGVGSAIAHYYTDSYNTGFLQYPVITFIHVALGGIYLLLAPFQFVARIRSRWLGYHRIVGRVLVSIGLVLGGSALFIGLVFPFSGLPEQWVVGVFGSFFVFALIKGFLCIRRKEIAAHREWMIRAFSIGLSIATMRLLFVSMLIIIGANEETVRSLVIISFSIAFCVHAGVAELWIRYTRNTTVNELPMIA